jgi:hypothetical protein
VKQPGNAARWLRKPRVPRRDFRLTVQMLGGQPGQNSERLFREGERLAFRIEAERDAYVGVWVVSANDDEVVQVFPNKYEKEHLILAAKPRTVPAPSDKWVFRASPAQGPEKVWVVASTHFWAPILGKQDGPFAIFKNAEELEEWEDHVRGIMAEAKDGEEKPSVAELQLPFRVLGPDEE